jgi:hypothetical protein
MAAAHERRESLKDVLLDLRHAVGGHGVLADRLGISGKTLERYTHRRLRPPPLRRLSMMRALAGLDVPQDQWPRPLAPAPVHAGQVEPSLDLAVFLAAEQHGMSAARARLVVLDVLGRMHGLGVDVPTAHAALSALVSKRPARQAAAGATVNVT